MGHTAHKVHTEPNKKWALLWQTLYLFRILEACSKVTATPSLWNKCWISPTSIRPTKQSFGSRSVRAGSIHLLAVHMLGPCVPAPSLLRSTLWNMSHSLFSCAWRYWENSWKSSNPSWLMSLFKTIYGGQRRKRQFDRECDSAESGNGRIRDGHGATDEGVFGRKEAVQGCADGETNTEVKRMECKALCSLETSRSEPALTWL